MPRYALAAAGAGLVSALFYLALLTGSIGSFLVYLAQLPLFLVGLWAGAGGAALAGVAAFVILTFVSGAALGAFYLVVTAAPSAGLAYFAQLNRVRDDGQREFYPPGFLLAAVCGWMSALFLMICVALSGEPGGIQGATQRAADSVMLMLTSYGVSAEMTERIAPVFQRYLPGVMCVFGAVTTILNAVLAQRLLARRGLNFRPSPAMADIDLPNWMYGAFAIAMFGSFLPGLAGFVGGNLSMIFLLGYTLAGLGVAHAVAARLPFRSAGLTLLYVLIFVLGWPAMVLALLGLAEPWLNLRRRTGGATGA